MSTPIPFYKKDFQSIIACRLHFSNGEFPCLIPQIRQLKWIQQPMIPFACRLVFSAGEFHVSHTTNSATDVDSTADPLPFACRAAKPCFKHKYLIDYLSFKQIKIVYYEILSAKHLSHLQSGKQQTTDLF